MASTLKEKVQGTSDEVPFYNEWNSEELAEKLHWTKEGTAILIGLLFGFCQIKGIIGLLFFGALIAVISVSFTRIARVCGDTMSQWDIISEGFMPCLMTFVLVWSVTYTFTFF